MKEEDWMLGDKYHHHKQARTRLTTGPILHNECPITGGHHSSYQESDPVKSSLDMHKKIRAIAGQHFRHG